VPGEKIKSSHNESFQVLGFEKNPVADIFKKIGA